MDFKNQIVIKKDLKSVWSAFTAFNLFKNWQSGLKSMDHIEGEIGRPGAVRMLTFEKGGRVTAVKEQILKREDPHDITILYVTDNTANLSHNYFEEMPNGSTHWVVQAHFEIHGWQKYFAYVFKNRLKSEILEKQKAFKHYIESV